jgi:putative ABC transport system permease protein
LREYKSAIQVTGKDINEAVMVRLNSMDFDFMDVFKMKLLAGRNFSASFPKDPDTSVIITESASRLLGFATPTAAIGKTLYTGWNGWTPIIVGVVNDYHQVSFKKPLEPTMFTCDAYEGNYFSVRLHTNQLTNTLALIEHAWKKAFPGNPFGYFFLDDYFNRQYNNDKKFGQLFLVFAILAIIISCLGLLGLSSYTAGQRTREVGIRKVLGASVLNITTLLSKDFLLLVAIAVMIATPFAWLIMNRWLQSFAYREPMHWWVFALSGIISVLIALCTVGFQAIKAATANPVKSLRND